MVKRFYRFLSKKSIKSVIVQEDLLFQICA